MRASTRPTRGTGSGRLSRRSLRAGVVTLTALLAIGGLSAVATADEDPIPTQAEVDAAKRAADDKAGDVASIQADLVLANQRLQDSAIAAAKAAEAYNGARWRLEQARTEVRAAEKRERRATAALKRQQRAYGDALASSYAMAPELTAMSAMLDADGPNGVMERYTTLDSAESAMDNQYDDFRALSTLASVATDNAEDARAEAAALEREADEARVTAQAAADAAAVEAESVAAEKNRLIGELASLQHISVALAGERQQALEEAAARAAAEAARKAAEDEAQDEPSSEGPSDGPSEGPGDGPSGDPTDEPTDEPMTSPPTSRATSPPMSRRTRRPRTRRRLRAGPTAPSTSRRPRSASPMCAPRPAPTRGTARV